uniref:Uncharacterized protein n=1 Tax=Rhizophora mucronata TaxID=61149 RepID=A0A2P2NSJ9_RHIMU
MEEGRGGGIMIDLLKLIRRTSYGYFCEAERERDSEREKQGVVCFSRISLGFDLRLETGEEREKNERKRKD